MQAALTQNFKTASRKSGDRQEIERLGVRTEEVSREIELVNRRAYEVTLMGKSRK